MSTSRIKVVHLTIGLHWGGAEKLMADVATRLDPARFDVKVVALQKDGPVGHRLRDAGIAVTTLQTANRWDPRAYFRLRQYLAAEKPDIVHSHLLRANLLACLTRGDHAVVWHDHCLGDWLNPVLRVLERRLIGRSDAVIAVSNSVREDLLSRVPHMAIPIRILPNAIDMSRTKPSLPNDKDPDYLTIGYVGRLDEKAKGISYLLHSVAILKKTIPSVRVILVGEGADQPMLSHLSLQLGISDSVRFAGSRSDVNKIGASFDVLALPSLSEGFGIVLLEAMAHSVPVVASRVGGIPEVVIDHETGLLVPPGDASALAIALEELLRDPVKRRQMGQKGLERVQAKYDLGRFIPKLEQIYLDIQNTNT